MILRNYIGHRVLEPMLAALSFLLALYLAWAATDLIGAGGAASMTASEFLRLVSLQALTVLDLLIPMSLSLAIVFGLGQMSMNQEIMAIRTAGGGESMILFSVLVIAMIFTILIALLMLNFRAPIFEHIYDIKQSISDDSDFRRIQAGEFYLFSTGSVGESADSQRVVFADRSEGDRLFDVFVARSVDGFDEFIFASEAIQHYDASGQQIVNFDRGYLYKLQEQDAMQDDWHFRFGELRLTMPAPASQMPTARRKSMTLAELAGNDDPFMLTEYQRRFAAPLSTLLLALLAVPLSRSRPRKSHYGKSIVAGIIMIVFFNVESLARSWVEQAVVPAFPGVFWPHMLMAALLVLVYWPRRKPARTPPLAQASRA